MSPGVSRARYVVPKVMEDLTVGRGRLFLKAWVREPGPA